MTVHHRFAEPEVGVDHGLVVAVVLRVQRKGDTAHVGRHLLLHDDRDARVVGGHAVLAFVGHDAFVEHGGEAGAQGLLQCVRGYAQGRFVAAGEGGAGEVFLW